MDALLVKASMLDHVKALEAKHASRPETHIKYLLDKVNGSRMSKHWKRNMDQDPKPK